MKRPMPPPRRQNRMQMKAAASEPPRKGTTPRPPKLKNLRNMARMMGMSKSY